MLNTAPFLAGGGELGALMRGKDWSHSPAGPPEVWPEAIKSTVALCLGSSTPIIVWIGSRSDRLVQLYNDAYRPVMGAEKHPWGLGRLGAEVWPEIWRDIMTPIFDEVLLNGRSVRRDDQYMVLHRNGYPEETWFTHYHSPLREADGTIVGVFTVVIEVSEQKRAERALRGLNEHLEAQVAARTEDRDRMWRLSTDVMLVADFDARIVSVNPAWTALFGWDEIELLSRNFLDLVHPDDREATLAETRKLEQGITTMRFENRYCQKDGGYRWISWTAVPDERFIHAVGRDITAEKAASIRLEEAQQALRQAQKMEAVGQLTGGIAHDFNNVLQAVAGGLDLIRRKPTDPDRVRQWAESSLEAADRGAKLTAQLLAFSRAQKLELKPVEINNLVERMKDLLGRTIGPDIRVNTVLSSELSAALGDATQIEMAVLNLTINARDAMPAGGHLMISTGRRIIKHAADLSAGDYIELSVEDTGTGMTPEVIERAFDPFFTTKGVGQGTGLGLSQVYGMARQAGGTVRIDSEVGRGTKVSIFFRATSEQFENLAAKTYTVDQITPARVLVVDDDISVRRFLIETLQALGYAAHEAENGREALRVLNDFRPDVAIVDFAMPDINGAQVAREIRAQRPGTAIVFASGFSDTNAIETAVGQQAVLLRKPFRIEDLRQAIEQVLH